VTYPLYPPPFDKGGGRIFWKRGFAPLKHPDNYSPKVKIVIKGWKRD
jgi:hypothetical protein